MLALFWRRSEVTEKGLKKGCPEIKMLELVREKEHIWNPKSELYSKKSLRKSEFDEIAATLR
ncbi:hypothetical protein E2C01_025277 [Portunus trituberculatus]|uniref:MADF domain-containing protein n=1 Tax=Portunus trituberculatus TaxID=210409 RepID=A0A5B7EFK1_PORTR|nr:hypothetical protein [Portunus trituberculatus]